MNPDFYPYKTNQELDLKFRDLSLFFPDMNNELSMDLSLGPEQ